MHTIVTWTRVGTYPVLGQVARLARSTNLLGAIVPGTQVPFAGVFYLDLKDSLQQILQQQMCTITSTLSFSSGNRGAARTTGTSKIQIDI